MQTFTDPTVLKWQDAAANVDGSPVTESIKYEVGLDAVAGGAFPTSVTTFSNVLQGKNVTKDATGLSVENVADITAPLAPGNYVASVREVNIADPANPIAGDWAAAIGIVVSDKRRPGQPTGFTAA